MKLPKFLAALALAALAAGTAPPALAQVADGQLVDSLESHRASIERVLEERLSNLIASKNYVLRVTVTGEPVVQPAAVQPGRVPDLPGFRQTPIEGAPPRGRFRVTAVTVRILINEELPPADLSYIRSLVPIVADFDPERGDLLEIEVVSPEGLVVPTEEAVEEALGEPGAPLAETLEEEIAGFTLQDWILIGLMALALLLLLIVLVRVMRSPKQPPMPAQPPAPAPPPAPKAPEELSVAEKAELEAQALERELEEVRKDVVKRMVARPDLARELIGSWQGQAKNLIAMVQAFGPTVARQTMMTHMDAAGYQTLEEAVRSEKPADTTGLIGILREANLILITQELAQPEDIRPDPFTFLGGMSRGQIGHLIKDEPVKIKAIVLSRIAPEHTAHILESMPQEMQLEVAVQIGNFQNFPLDAVSDIARNLAVKSRSVPDEKTVDIEGPKTLVNLMTRSSTETIRYLLDAMKGKDPSLSEEVERRFFLFDSIPLVPDEILPQVVRRMQSDRVVQAIQGADPDLQRKVIMAFPEQARTGMVTTLHAAKYDAQTVMEARQEVVTRMQQLAEEGRVDLKQISDAWQAQAQAS